MTQPTPLIHILPPQLANQIAAGEVVERPASVVKELVENSLDAGAGQIQIDIEKGGAQLIRIRDNGCGIGKHDLPLALARHATSKISSLEDLEAILSLGFRGEALASISSVSRLTLTSRPEYQGEAWQAYAQGREMAVEIQPASHPVGTTIEVANLFFNTPARRKFLRTDKTEFSHIDEVVRRIALAKPNVTFILTHNEKKMRHYRAVSDQSVAAQQRRVAEICGEDFVAQSVHLDWEHNGLHLYGWVAAPHFARSQNDLCYSYVNGRMMRDKTINHAIRQAYGERIGKDQYPAFVLFLDLDPSQVDVNVHPAKHEVRFHQGRLVHDFIYQGVLEALGEPNLPLQQEVAPSVFEPIPNYIQDNNRAAAGQNVFAHFEGRGSAWEKSPDTSATPRWRGSNERAYTPSFSAPTASRQAQKWYGELLADPHGRETTAENVPSVAETHTPPTITQQSAPISPLACEPGAASGAYAQVLAVVAQKAVLLQQQADFYLLDIATLQRLNVQKQLAAAQHQPLLIPLSVSLDSAQAQAWQEKREAFAALGFEISEKAWQGQLRLSITKVPTLLREQNLQQLLLQALQAVDLLQFFAQKIPLATLQHRSEAVQLLAEAEKWHSVECLDRLKVPVDFSAWLDKL